MQEHCESINKPNPRIMGIEEREEGQVKGKVFNKIITVCFPSIKKKMPIQVQEISRTPNRHYQKRTST
jgi:hypothetical protein